MLSSSAIRTLATWCSYVGLIHDLLLDLLPHHRIEDILFESRVNFQLQQRVRNNFLLDLAGAGLLELVKQLFDPIVIVF